MCDTLYFFRVGRNFPEPLIGLVLRVILSAHILHYTHFVKSSRPPALDPLLAIFRFLPRPVSRGEKVPFDNVPEIVRLHRFGPLGPDRIE